MKVNDIPYQTAPSIFCLRGQYWVKPWLGSGTPMILHACLLSPTNPLPANGMKGTMGTKHSMGCFNGETYGWKRYPYPNFEKPHLLLPFYSYDLTGVKLVDLFGGVRVGSCNPDSSSTWLTHLWGCAIPFPNANGQFVWWCQNVSNKFCYVFLVNGDNFYGICSIRLKLLVGPINARPSWSDFMAKEPRCL